MILLHVFVKSDRHVQVQVVILKCMIDKIFQLSVMSLIKLLSIDQIPNYYDIAYLTKLHVKLNWFEKNMHLWGHEHLRQFKTLGN